VIQAAARVACSVHDAQGEMTAQVWKRGSAEPRVTFRCPWCDVVGASGVAGHHDQGTDVWLLVGCANFACRRGVMIRVPAASPWSRLETDDDGILLAAGCVHPRER
jgi:hypothetical protein